MARVIFDDGGNEGHTFLHNTISRVLVVMGKPAESHNVCVKNARQAARQRGRLGTSRRTKVNIVISGRWQGAVAHCHWSVGRG